MNLAKFVEVDPDSVNGKNFNSFRCCFIPKYRFWAGGYIRLQKKSSDGEVFLVREVEHWPKLEMNLGTSELETRQTAEEQAKRIPNSHNVSSAGSSSQGSFHNIEEATRVLTELVRVQNPRGEAGRSRRPEPALIGGDSEGTCFDISDPSVRDLVLSRIGGEHPQSIVSKWSGCHYPRLNEAVSRQPRDILMIEVGRPDKNKKYRRVGTVRTEINSTGGAYADFIANGEGIFGNWHHIFFQLYTWR